MAEATHDTIGGCGIDLPRALNPILKDHMFALLILFGKCRLRTRRDSAFDGRMHQHPRNPQQNHSERDTNGERL